MPNNEELMEQQGEEPVADLEIETTSQEEQPETPVPAAEETETADPVVTEETEVPVETEENDTLSGEQTNPVSVLFPMMNMLGAPVVPLAASSPEPVESSAEDEGDEEQGVIDVNDLEEDKPHHIVLCGRQGENLTQQVVIDCSHWADVLENPVYSIVALRPGEKETYLVHNVTAENNRLTWTIDSDDTARSGFGEAEIRGVSGEKVKKSAKFRTWIEPSVEDYTSPDPVTPPYWGTEILEATAASQAAAEAAEASAEEAAETAEHLESVSVRYDTDQTSETTAEEKHQARQNIGAVAVSVTEHTLTIGM